MRRSALVPHCPRAYRLVRRGATVVLIAASCMASNAFAQGAGTAPLVLRLPGGARALALGNAFIGAWGSEVLFYNPAQLERGAGITVSVARYDGASTLGILSSVMRMGSWTVGVGAQYRLWRYARRLPHRARRPDDTWFTRCGEPRRNAGRFPLDQRGALGTRGEVRRGAVPQRERRRAGVRRWGREGRRRCHYCASGTEPGPRPRDRRPRRAPAYAGDRYMTATYSHLAAEHGVPQSRYHVPRTY